jgi:hypothetical protein
MNSSYFPILLIIHSIVQIQSSMERDWSTFVKTHFKKYSNSAEETYRENVYNANLEKLKKLNDENLGYTVGVNRFGDMTVEESIKRFTGLKPKTKEQMKRYRSNIRKYELSDSTTLPTSYG